MATATVKVLKFGALLVKFWDNLRLGEVQPKLPAYAPEYRPSCVSHKLL